MIQGKKSFLAFAAIIACSFGSQAFAVDQGCIVVKSVAEVEQAVVNDKGEKSTKLVPLTTAVPGTEVIYTTIATNNCKQAAEKLAISNFVPEHMTYVPNSAFSPGGQAAYSLDGKSFAVADQLTVQENGVARKARADEYRFFRWVFPAALPPGSSATARFRAKLN